jgi:hypothetical protein
MHAIQVREHMSVICSDGSPCGTVNDVTYDHLIELSPDDMGLRHWIPMARVGMVDDKVHLERTAAEVRREWLQTPPGATSTTPLTKEGGGAAD